MSRPKSQADWQAEVCRERARAERAEAAIRTALDDNHRGFGGGITHKGEAVLRAALDTTETDTGYRVNDDPHHTRGIGADQRDA